MTTNAGTSTNRATDFTGRKVLILGLGVLRGGIGMAEYCFRHGAQLRITDLRDENVLRPALDALAHIEADYVLGGHREEDIGWADLIIRNPGVPPNHELLRLAKRLGKPVDMEIAYFVRNAPCPIIAVTGTKGKTTVTTVLHQFLRSDGSAVHVAGNMGASAMTLLDDLSASDEVLLEISSYQLEGMVEHPGRTRVAVITNVEDDHLDRYGDLATYRGVKASIAAGQLGEDVLIIPAWDAELGSLVADLPSRKVLVCDPDRPVSAIPGRDVHATVTVDGGAVRWHPNAGTPVLLADLSELPLRGRHNQINVAFAAAAAFAAGREPRHISPTVAKLTPVAHRFEPVLELDGIEFINDSAASAPIAVVAALRAVGNRRVVVIAGGQDKAAEYAPMVNALAQAQASVVLLPGSATERIKAGLAKTEPGVHWEPADSMAEAVETAFALARKESAEVVLLSPGSASFGLFVNEFDRGAQFVKEVRALRP